VEKSTLPILATLLLITAFDHPAHAQTSAAGQSDGIRQPVFLNLTDPVTVSVRDFNDAETDGMTSDGVETDGMTSDGIETNGMSTDGINTDGINTDGESTDGIDTGGVDTDGIDSN